MKACILDVDAAKYHADRLCAEPTLSASIACILCNDSPAHAKARHPRLTENPVKEEAEHFDIGTIAHALLLEGIDKAEPLDFPDWRKKEARDARDAARDAGKIPILRHKLEDVYAMVNAASDQIAAHKEASDMFTNGKPEQTIIWEDEGVICRARIDWLHNSYLNIDDYKSTGSTANPDVVSRTLFNTGCDIQAAFYLRGLKAVTGKDARFRFFFQETFPPYAGCVIALDPYAMTLAEKRVQYAIEKWRDCLNSGVWPAYIDKVCFATPPSYFESQWLERELRGA